MSANGSEPLLVVEGLVKHYPIHGGVWGGTVGTVKAVDGVSLSVPRGGTLGLVGESGCGKSTLGRTIIRLEEPTEGSVRFKGHDLATASKSDLFGVRRDMQMVFQDPYSSLNPRMTIGEIVREPLLVHRAGSKEEQARKVEEVLRVVGLSADTTGRYPHEFSGGQRQRVGLARALVLDPELVIADEPVSALDVSVQSQALNLMVKLQRERGLAYLFISHDLSVVRHVSDVVAIMYLGRIVERGPAEAVFNHPAHPYTRALVAAIPVPDPTNRHVTVPLEGETPSPVSPPSGCPFHPRCPFATERCAVKVPVLEAVTPAPAVPAVRGLTASPKGVEPDGRRGAGETAVDFDTHLVSCLRKDEI